MRKIAKVILTLSVLATTAAYAADRNGRVWIVKPHPARMCADPTDDIVNDEAVKLEKIGVPVFESKVEIDQTLFAAKLECGRTGYYLMAHWVPEAAAEKAKKMGYHMTSDNYVHQVASDKVAKGSQ